MKNSAFSRWDAMIKGLDALREVTVEGLEVRIAVIMQGASQSTAQPASYRAGSDKSRLSVVMGSLQGAEVNEAALEEAEKVYS
ncbi:hypothetical protein CERZMDRAFT_115439 [Cercospora zeae-maydis SCOH1-5]|uniref:Uncharacterized protein n=1 Tax=Cercospora zeae-maydis SCOH1-5 TaxID=717836 RepID=A0A6A6EZ43_9PEZI|nr:hypothetical protein CERZMDRAFT_115439 [Cercospora zeae-maydis SCOH1-5]